MACFYYCYFTTVVWQRVKNDCDKKSLERFPLDFVDSLAASRFEMPFFVL